MMQTKEECLAFLAEARGTLDELSLISDQERQLCQEEDRLEKALEAEKKAVADQIRLTIKKRLEEINASYDKEITKGQEELKRVRSRREKAKTQGVQARIEEETSVLKEHNQELQAQMKSLFQENHVPVYCRSSLYYSLYFPRWFGEIMVAAASIAIAFVLVPYGLYYLIPHRNPLFLAGIYVLAILLFGGIYVGVGNKGKLLHLEVLKQGRAIRDQIHSNNKKIKVITSTIRKDRNESMYDLVAFDDDIARAEQELSQVSNKKKEAMNTFETVTKTILSDEIEHNSKSKIEELQTAYEQTTSERKEVEAQRKEKKLFVTDHYEAYLGSGFLDPIKIAELITILQNGQAQNLTEALASYKKTSS